MSESSLKTNLASNKEGADGVGFKVLAVQNVADITQAIENARDNKSFIAPALVPGRLPATSGQSKDVPLTFLDLSALCQIKELSKEDKVIKVECGITIDALNKLLAKDNLWFPVFAPSRETTLFDVINTGDGGFLEQGFGGLKKLVLGMDVILANGNAITCGGRVVKNVTGYDMTKLFIGARATLGIVTAAYLRLSALPKATKTLVFAFDSVGDAFAFAAQIARHNLPVSCLELLSATLSTKIKLPIKPSGKTKALALVEIYGQAEQIQEVSKEINNLAKPVKAANLDYKTATDMWANIASIAFANNLSFVDIKNKQTNLCQIAEGLAQPLWQARPNCRRLTAFVESKQAQEALIDDLSNKANAAGQAWEIAYANDEFAYKVETIPREDSNMQSLRAKIKSRFDAENIFNPLVHL
jgi:FAD/FMN-containing dehydrogenase